MYRNSELTHIGLLAALITVTGAIKIEASLLCVGRKALC